MGGRVSEQGTTPDTTPPAAAGGASEGTTAAAPANDQRGTTPVVVTAAAAVVDAAALAQFREAIVAANPQAIPELIAGESFAAIQASVEGAKAAFTRVSEAVKAGGAVAPPKIPAGGGAPPPVDVSKMSPMAKISHGIAQEKQRRASS